MFYLFQPLQLAVKMLCLETILLNTKITEIQVPKYSVYSKKKKPVHAPWCSLISILKTHQITLKNPGYPKFGFSYLTKPL